MPGCSQRVLVLQRNLQHRRHTCLIGAWPRQLSQCAVELTVSRASDCVVDRSGEHGICTGRQLHSTSIVRCYVTW
jgi:hypothetical protein